MAGYIPALPTETSGAPELNRWEGVRTEPSLSERIDGHVPYPGPPPAYDVENYARYSQWRINAAVAGLALQLEHKLAAITLTGATVGNQRRITVNGTNIDYSDASGDTLADVTQAFVDLINGNAILTAGASAVQADYVTAGVLAVYSIAAGTAPTFSVSVSVLAGTGTIAAATATTPDVVIPATVLGGVSRNIVLGSSANDAGADNDTRLVLDRTARAVRVGNVTGTEWDTRQDDSIGLGTMAQPDGADSVAVGTSAVAADRYDVAIGAGASADGQTGSGALALGRLASATGSASTAVGIGAAASGTQADAFGRFANASGDGALALGLGSVASGDRSVCAGNSDATGDDAVAVGTGCTSSGIGSFCSGGANSSANLRAGGDGSKAHGHVSATATGNTIIADGDGADAHGSIPAAVTAAYSGATASGDLSRAHGRGVTASGDFSRAYGDGAVAAAYGETAHASGVFISAGARQLGTAQDGVIRLLGETVGSNVNLTFGNPASPVGEWDPPSGAYTIDVRVSALTSAGDRSMWTGQVAVYSAGGTVTIDAGGGNLTLLSDSAAIFVLPPQIAASGATLRLTARPPAGGAPTRWFCEMRYARVSL